MIIHRAISAIEGLAFPGLPDAQGRARLALLFQLEQTQWWPPDELRRHQFEQLRVLLDQAVRHVPFYRDGPYRTASERLDLDQVWSSLPMLTRSAVQEAGARLFAESVPPVHGATTEMFTSGSTGRPVRALRTQLWEMIWNVFTLRDHLWHRRDLAGKLAGIRESGAGKAVYPDGVRTGTWGSASGQVFATGPYVGLNVTTPVERMADWLAREDPDYLLTHPTIAWRLARHFLETNRCLARLRQVETLAEVVPPDLRRLCREAWGVPVVDMYSTREVGYVAFQCPDHEHYHVQAEGILVEVLDGNDQPCRPGEIGRVVVTPLHNFAMPLVRYELGDYAQVGEQCPCGRGLQVLTRVLGRKQNMLRKPNGDELWPLLSSPDIGSMASIAPIRRYQIAQTALDALVLRIVAARPLDPDERAALSEWTRRKFGPEYRIDVTEHDDLPLGPGGKFQDVVNEIGGPARAST